MTGLGRSLIRPLRPAGRLGAVALAALLSLVVGAAAPAAAAAAAARPTASGNTALVPVTKLEPDSYDWFARHAQVLALQRRLDPEIVLIGDSITHFWGGEPKAARVNGAAAWEATFGGHRVLNMGFGWDRTQNVLWRLQHGEFTGIHPRWVVLHIGTNNFTGTGHARENTPAEVAEAIVRIVRLLHARSPRTEILVMGVLPRGERPGHPYRAKIEALNTVLPIAVAGLPRTRFFDIGARFLEPDGTLPRRLMPDETHPSDAGYAVWGASLEEAGVTR